MPEFTLKVLGPPQVETADRSPVKRLSPSSAALLAYLSLQRKPVARAHLASLFWPRAETSKARHSLRQLLSRIRARLPGLIVASGEQAGVDMSMLEVDVHRFEREIRERRIQSALGLWRGHFMEGWAWPESWELEDWIERERTRLDRLLEAAVAEAAEGLLAANRSGDSSKLLSQALSALPNSEGLILLQARALAALGYRPEAESVLVGSDLDEEGQGFQDALEEIRNGNGNGNGIWVPAPPEPEVPVLPEPEVPVLPEPEVPVLPEPEVLEGAGGLGDSPDGPHSTGEVTPEKTAAAPHRSWFRRNGVWVSLLAAAMAVVAFLGLDGEGGSPPVVGLRVPPVEIWFCSHREEEYAFRMDENGDDKFSLTRELVCPVIPVNGGEKAITFRNSPDHIELGELVNGHFRLIAGPFRRVGFSGPARQVGPLDGTISPDGRQMVAVLEVKSESGVGAGGPDTSALPRFPDGIGDFEADALLDLFLIDLEDGTLARMTHDAARDYEPRFLPDGSGVIWGSQRDGPGDLYFMELESGEIDRLTFGTLPARDPSVQGKWVAYHRGWGDGAEEGDQDLFLFDRTTGTERRLTENDWNDTGPELSHDSRMICWTSKKEGHWEAEIMAMDLETGATWHVSDMPGREDYCQWHPSVPVVFFQVWGTGEQEVYRSDWGARGPSVNLSRHVTADHTAVVMRVGVGDSRAHQHLLVVTEAPGDVQGRLFRMEGPDEGWRQVGDPVSVVVGRGGIGPKEEGDGRSPEGSFALGPVFGYAPVPPPGMDVSGETSFPYQPLSSGAICVDDPGSAFYNQVFNPDTLAADAPGKGDWKSAETMRRDLAYGDDLYRWGVLVRYNDEAVAGAGSCIFLHVWSWPGSPTAGCTAMAEEDLLSILGWLKGDPGSGVGPILVQGTRAYLESLRAEGLLPYKIPPAP